MTTYRTGNNWGVTIIREGHGEPNASNCGRVDDQLVAVVVNGDQDLAERICERLNAPTPDVPYTHGAAEALAEVRRRLDAWDKLHPLHDARPAVATVMGMLRDAAAELGVSETAPAQRPSAGGSGRPEAHSGAEAVTGWEIGMQWRSGHPRVFAACEECDDEIDISAGIGLAELNRRAEEHAQVCR